MASSIALNETVDHLRLEIDGREICNPAVQLRCVHSASPTCHPDCDLVTNLSSHFGQEALATRFRLVHNHISLQIPSHCNQPLSLETLE